MAVTIRSLNPFFQNNDIKTMISEVKIMFWEGIRRKRSVLGPFRLSLDISILWLIALLLLINRMATYSFFFLGTLCAQP